MKKGYLGNQKFVYLLHGKFAETKKFHSKTKLVKSSVEVHASVNRVNEAKLYEGNRLLVRINFENRVMLAIPAENVRARRKT